MLRYKVIALIACCILSPQTVNAADDRKEYLGFLQLQSARSDLGLPQRGITKIVKFHGPHTTEYRRIYLDGFSKVARFHHSGPLCGQYFLYCDSGNVLTDIVINQWYKNSVDAQKAFHFFQGLYERLN